MSLIMPTSFSAAQAGPAAFRQAFLRLAGGCRVVPVLTIGDLHLATPVAAALLAGGVTTIEVTLRTPAALDVIAQIVRTIPGLAVGAGTVMAPSQIDEAVDAGARFLVSPGTTPRLADAAASSPVPFLPGVATVSEAMRLRELGFSLLKLFPATTAGGLAFLDGVRPVLGDVAFCPTGGVTAANAGDYLSRANVACVGGSWLTPAAAIAARDFEAIEQLARESQQWTG